MDIISKVIKNKLGTIKIHGIQTGRLAIKKKAFSAKRPGQLSTVLSFRDREFAAWLPVWAWVIEHPEGVFLIDTGQSSAVNTEGYFNQLDFISKYYCEKQMKYRISRKEEIDSQLSEIGLSPASISKIILTHLHIDHTGGLKHFPLTPILISEREWKTKDSAFPQLFPQHLNVEEIQLNEAYQNFENSYYLTKARDVIVVATPGDTRGHVSIILEVDNDNLIFFAGDVAYTQKRLLDSTFSSTIKSHALIKDSCAKVIELMRTKNVLFLPSHDNDNGERLNSIMG